MAPRIHPDRIKRAAEMRQLGHTYAEIGRIMCLSAAYVRRILTVDSPRHYTCRVCRKEMTTPDARAKYSRLLLCMDCLVQLPDPRFRDRLIAHRLAAGFTVRALAKLTRTVPGVIHAMEQGRTEPSWRVLVRLVKAIGMKLLLIPPLAPSDSLKRSPKLADEEE